LAGQWPVVNTVLGRIDARNCWLPGGTTRRSTSTPPRPGPPVVIGIDGTAEARALIDSGQSPLRATVVQDMHRMANHVVDVLLKLRQGQARAPDGRAR
jgi:hypothetical protein